jgi:iron complex outermembrane receptor protein
VTIAGAPASAAALAPTLGQFGPQANASDISGDRSLLPATEQLSVNAVMNRTLFGDISATVNGSASVSTRESLLGPAQARLSVPAGNPFSPAPCSNPRGP